MAITFAPKYPDDVKRYSWRVPVLDGDTVSTVDAATGSGVTVDSYELVDNDVVMFLSAGTASTTGIVTLSVTTDAGETLDETGYIPILAANGVVSHSETAQTIIEAAMRSTTGIAGAAATSDELSAALEELNDMLAEWRTTGADIGAPRLALATNVYAPDGWIGAIKKNLRVRLADLFPMTPLDAGTAVAARKGLAAIKNDILANRDPNKAVYY